ncbi:MAG: PilW family protein [Nitrospiraceae bacterium]
MNQRRPRSFQRIRNAAGMCLTGLMVAMASGAIVLSATLQTLQYSQQRFRMQQETIGQYQDLRIGLEVMTGEIRLAGTGSSMLGPTLQKSGEQDIEFVANIGGFVTHLTQSASSGQQELIVSDGMDWQEGKRIIVCSAQYCMESRLAKDGQRTRLTLANPLGQAFPLGSEVVIANEVRYYQKKDERGVARIMRQIDGGANTLIGDVTHFKLGYFGKDGRPTVNPNQVVRVRLEIAVTNGGKIIVQDVSLQS